jgi:undecaprenyl-diphosphatase
MNYTYSIIAGIIQGLTEFLPISSSGHFVVFHDLFNFEIIDSLSFDVILHLGTLVALLLFFFPAVIKYSKAFFRSLIEWDLKNDSDQYLAWLILVSIIPAGVVGYLFENQIENVFRQIEMVAWLMLIFGIILFLADKYAVQSKTINQLTLKNSLIIGLLQILALWPGVSRSAITIIAGLNQKLKRRDAAEFSFLISLPLVFAAGVKKSIDLISGPALDQSEIMVLSVGFLTSVVVGYLCIKYFLQFLQRHSLKVFAYYRIILGVIILLFLYLN